MRRLRSRRSVVSRVPESDAPESKGSRITTFLYTIVLLAVLATAGYLVLDRFLHLEAKGTVRVEATKVATPRAGQITTLGVAAGDTVRRGDVLARIDPYEVCAEEGPGRDLDIEMQARRDSIALVHLRRRLRAKRARLDRMRTQRALELGPDYAARLRSLVGEIEEMESRREGLRADLALARAQADSLRRARRPDPRCEIFPLRAPHDGVVGPVFREPYESLSAREPLLAITPREPEVAVFATFQPDEYADLPTGGEVEITFPDGSEARGVIERAFASAEQFPSPKWEGYRPVPSVLLVKIRPASADQARRWRTFDRMAVEVRRMK